MTVTATVAVGTPGSGDCNPETGGPGSGFLNSADLTVEGITSVTTRCAARTAP